MERIIIDADPGVDDSVAIMFAAKSDELFIEGITTIGGNSNMQNSINNTFKSLDLVDRNDIPVFKGIDISLDKNNINAEEVYGKNGFGDVNYEPIKREVGNMSAIDFIIKTVIDNPQKITLVAFGPLTNISSAVIKNVDFAKNVKRLVLMGGAINDGNIKPYAEFNFYKDPNAAKTVLNADFNEIVMIGLDVTTKLTLKEKYEKKLLELNTELSNLIYKATRIGAKFDRSKGKDGLVVNDQLNIAYLLDESVVKTKSANVNVITEGDLIGKSEVTWVENSNIKVAYEVDHEKVYKMLFKKLFNIDLN